MVYLPSPGALTVFRNELPLHAYDRTGSTGQSYARIHIGNERPSAYPFFSVTGRQRIDFDFDASSGSSYDSRVTVHIGDLPSDVSLSVATAGGARSVKENGGVNFNVTPSAASTLQYAVDWAIAAGGSTPIQRGPHPGTGDWPDIKADTNAAHGGGAGLGKGGTLTFAANSADTQTIRVEPFDDAVGERNETFTIRLFNRSGGWVTLPDAGAIPVVTIADNDGGAGGGPRPGVTVTPTALAVEEGGTGTYTVVLDTAPTGTATVTPVSGDTASVRVTPAALTFSGTTWNQPQTVTVTGGDDDIDNPSDRMATIMHSVSGYGSVTTAPAVTVTVTDDDVNSVVASETALTVEEGASATYELTLGAVPTDTVTVAVAVSDTTRAMVSPAELTFAPEAWDEPQTVTVTATDDFIAGQADRTVTVEHSVSGYGDVTAGPSVALTVTDDDMASVAVSDSAVAVSEDGGTAAYTLVLTSQPAGEVTVTAMSSEPASATVSPASLTFTADDWSVRQTVTVTGVNDDIDSPEDRTAKIGHAVTGYDDVMEADPVAVTVIDDDVAGVELSRASVEVQEDASETYTVALTSQPTGGPVTVRPSSSDAGAATVAPAMLTFTATDWGAPQMVTVTGVNDDVTNEANRAATISHAVSGYGDVTAPQVAVSVRDVPTVSPQGWIARFGRTAMDQVIDAAQDRMRMAGTGQSTSLTLGGQRFDASAFGSVGGQQSAGGSAGGWSGGGQQFGGGSPLSPAAGSSGGGQRLGGTSPFGSMAGSLVEGGSSMAGTGAAGLLSRSSFMLGVGGRDGSETAGRGAAQRTSSGLGAVWGRVAQSGFSGGAGSEAVEGTVSNALLGADYHAGSATVGLIVSYAQGSGTGGLNGSTGQGDPETSLAGVYPWAQYAISPRISLWGMGGYGSGSLSLNRGTGQTAEQVVDTGLTLAMAAVGGRGILAQSGSFDLAVKLDAATQSSSSEAATGTGGLQLLEADAAVTRLRFGLEGAWRGGAVQPSVEVGGRYDGGDAETGLGFDLGGGLTWASPSAGIAASVDGRTLLTHAAEGFGEWGVAGSLAWDPSPNSAAGPQLRVTQTAGAAATGGLAALFQNDPTQAFRSGRYGQSGAYGLQGRRQRLQARFGYGWLAGSGRYAITPDIRYEQTEAGRQYSHTWRLSQAGGTGPRLAFDVEANRRELDFLGADPQHELLLRAGWRLAPMSGLDLSAQLEGVLTAAAAADVPAHRFGISLTGRWSGSGATFRR